MVMVIVGSQKKVLLNRDHTHPISLLSRSNDIEKRFMNVCCKKDLLTRNMVIDRQFHFFSDSLFCRPITIFGKVEDCLFVSIFQFTNDIDRYIDV